MTCAKCGCEGGGIDGATAAEKAGGLRKLFVLEKRVTVVAAASGSETPVFTTPAAAGIDVYLKSPDASATGNELIRAYAVNRTVSGIVDTRKQNSIFPDGQALSLRDYPADEWIITLDGSTTNPGAASTFEVVVIGWGQEPTGIGPNRLTPVKIGSSVLYLSPPPAWNLTTLPMVGQSSLSSGSWLPFGLGYAGEQTFVGNASLFANTLPMGVYHTAAQTIVNDGDAFNLQVDVNGNLKVALTSASGNPQFPAAAALGDGDANPTTTRIGAEVQYYNGATWDRGRSGSFGATGLSSFTGFADVIPVGRFTSARPTLTDGQGWFFQLDVNGNLCTVEQKAPVYEDNTNGVAATADLPQAGTTYNATAADIIAKANTGTIKAGAGNLYRLYVTNDAATTQAYALVNKASNPATNDVPLMYFYVPTKTTMLIEFRFGKRFSTGIAWAQVTTFGAGTITLAGTSDSLIDAEYK